MAVTQYTTLAKLQKRLSVEGVSLRLDDDPLVWSDVIDDASVLINEHCELLYDTAQLAVSDWVNKIATDLAVHELCERRANPSPSSVTARYERAMERLEMVRLGTLAIPDAAQRKDAVPVLSNVRVRMDPFPRTVVERNRSTGTPAGYKQHRDVTDVFDYSI